MHPQRLLVRILLLAAWWVVPTTGQMIRLPGSSSNNNNKKKSDETTAVAAAAAAAGSTGTLHKGLDHVLHWGDAVWVGAVGWLTEPLSRLVYHTYHRAVYGGKQEDDDNDDDSSAESVVLAREEDYKKTWLFRIASTVGQLGRVMGLVYVTDVATLLICKMGFPVPEGMNKRLANLFYAIFGAQKVRQLKTWWLRKWFGKHETGTTLKGRERLMDLIVDGTIGFLLFFMIQDIFSLTMGRSLQSLFAIGGISGIMISLASKDLAQLLLSGFVIRSSDKYIEGESIKLGDGTSGTITNLGAFEMHIRGGDGIITRIPNVQIVNQRVQNLSRMTETQIKQTLWFRYDDIDKIPLITQSIEEEIKATCGENLLSVRALWTEFKEDHLEVVVSTLFTIKPTSSDASEMKEKVLLAISKAVRKKGVEFAIPTSICRNENVPPPS